MYGVEMRNAVLQFSHPNLPSIRKVFLGGDQLETFFDLAWRLADGIDKELIPVVDHFILGNQPEIDPNEAQFGCITNSAHLYLEGIVFYNPDGEIIQSVPLEHFKEIALAWRDFLNSQPLNGECRYN